VGIWTDLLPYGLYSPFTCLAGGTIVFTIDVKKCSKRILKTLKNVKNWLNKQATQLSQRDRCLSYMLIGKLLVDITDN